MATKKLQVSNLEFDEIKDNLKTFIADYKDANGNQLFSDFNFEGSNLSVLLDVLAYNTYYNNIYTNMAVNETFLDSASKRSSVVSRATELGYTPRSAKSAYTYIDFDVTTSGTLPLTIGKNTTFTGSRDGVQYTFYTMGDVTSTPVGGVASFSDVLIKEGKPVTQRFLYNSSNKFTLSNKYIDLDTLTVMVQIMPTTNFTTYVNADTLDVVEEDTTAYFIREIDGLYEMSFGDGVLGLELEEGQIINVSYMVSSREGANEIKTLSYGGSAAVSNISLSYQTTGGRSPETIDQIKFNAPNFYASQNRIVTAADYETLILSKVPSIESVAVWGGELSSPPAYGKVFISAKTYSGKDLLYAEQQDIINQVLNKYKMVSVIPEFIHPEYINVELDVVVYYDKNKTVSTAEEIKSKVINAIMYYDQQELGQFDKLLRRTTITHTVENTDVSIISSVPRMVMHRTVTPIYNNLTSYTINIGNPFVKYSIVSTGFYISGVDTPCYIEDYGWAGKTNYLGEITNISDLPTSGNEAGDIWTLTNGSNVSYIWNGSNWQKESVNLRLITYVSGVKTVLKEDIGTVDYDAGIIQINNINILRLATSEMSIRVTPSSADVVSLYNQIVQIDEDLLRVTVVQDDTTGGRNTKGNDYTFYPSRI